MPAAMLAADVSAVHQDAHATRDSTAYHRSTDDRPSRRPACNARDAYRCQRSSHPRLCTFDRVRKTFARPIDGTGNAAHDDGGSQHCSLQTDHLHYDLPFYASLRLCGLMDGLFLPLTCIKAFAAAGCTTGQGVKLPPIQKRESRAFRQKPFRTSAPAGSQRTFRLPYGLTARRCRTLYDR
jgi:hypothetical protein